MSSNSKRIRNQKRAENRQLKKQNVGKISYPNQNVIPKKVTKTESAKKTVVSKDDISPVIMDAEPKSKLCYNEKLRERNIQERNNLFKKLKIDQMKEVLKVKAVSK